MRKTSTMVKLKQEALPFLHIEVPFAFETCDAYEVVRADISTFCTTSYKNPSFLIVNKNSIGGYFTLAFQTQDYLLEHSLKL